MNKPVNNPSYTKYLNDHIVKPIQKYFESRSTNPDLAFRERTIRTVAVLLLIVSALSLSLSLFIFHDPITIIPLSIPFVDGVNLLLLIFTLILLDRKRVTAAGIMMTADFLFILIGVTVLDGYWGSLLPPVLILSLMVSALALPRSALWPASILSVVTVTVVTLLEVTAGRQPPYDLSAGSQISNFIVISLITLIILNGIQGEFASRLSALQAANREVAEANRQRLIAMEKAVQSAEEANRAKSQFLANMSHELRTPLNAIIGYIEIMLGGMAGTFTDKQSELQRHVHNNAKRLLSLINDILDLAKIESGTLQLFSTPSSPRKFVTETVDAMQSLATNQKITLTATFTDEVPEVVMCDVRKVQQIITNLAGNAIKFTKQGGVTIAVSTPTKEEWQIKVIDTGAGMPQDAVNYIFEVFRQVDNTDTRQHQGTGLGLAITKSLIDRMGGRITVDTEIGKGSTFTVILPRVIGERTLEKEKQEPQKIPA